MFCADDGDVAGRPDAAVRFFFVLVAGVLPVRWFVAGWIGGRAGVSEAGLCGARDGGQW